MRSLLRLAVACTVLCGAAQARSSYDCADHASIPAQERWSPSQAQIGDVITTFFKVFPSNEHFSIRMCGITEAGKQMMLVGAIHIVDSKSVCDDDLNFAVLYDPEAKKYGDVVPHQKFCGGGNVVHKAQ